MLFWLGLELFSYAISIALAYPVSSVCRTMQRERNDINGTYQRAEAACGIGSGTGRRRAGGSLKRRRACVARGAPACYGWGSVPDGPFKPGQCGVAL